MITDKQIYEIANGWIAASGEETFTARTFTLATWRRFVAMGMLEPSHDSQENGWARYVAAWATVKKLDPDALAVWAALVKTEQAEG